ncbi:hypothetical protein [Nonomuraea sp. NPDC023979]|uniref:hypothetical protein n=1 Tax=Nonomuraea sp. NPDC023979 TaxID=3154796 RepID=UPI0033E9598B
MGVRTVRAECADHYSGHPITMRQAHHPEQAEIALTEVMAALSDPIRVGLVRVPAAGRERGWGELRAPA